MKKTILSILILMSIGCSQSGGGGGSNTPSVTGIDLSGSWRTIGVECYDSTLQNLTAVGTVSASSATGTITINGNTATSASLGTGSCRIDMTRSFVANLVGGTATNGYGTGSFGASTASLPSGSSCTGSVSFDMSQGAVNPGTITTTYSQGQAVPSVNFDFIINGQFFAIASLLQVVGQPSDICFLIYQKL